MTRIRIHPALVQGAVSFTRPADAALRPWRLPADELSLFPSPDDGLVMRAGCPSGVRLRFATTSPWVEARLRPSDPAGVSDEEPFVVDLTSAGIVVESRRVENGAMRLALEPSTDCESTDEGLPIYEIWLNQARGTLLESVEIEDGSAFDIPADIRPRWLAYGSSITMCRTAYSPARTWPATAARRLNLNLTNLGFGGQCHLDPMVGRVIRNLPADVITVKLGINVYGGASLGPRTYQPAVIGLISTIRDGHSRTPIGVITSIVSPSRERVPNAVGCTLEDYRAMTREAVLRLQEHGDEHLLLFEGSELFCEDDAHLLPDGLHPSGAGYELMGNRAAELVLPRLGV